MDFAINIQANQISLPLDQSKAFISMD